MQVSQLIEQLPAVSDSFLNFSIIDIIAIVMAAVAIIISIRAFKFDKAKALKDDQKYIREALEKAYAEMRSEKQLTAREKLYQLYGHYRKEKVLDIYFTPEAVKAIELVRLTFDEMSNTYGTDDDLKYVFVANFWTQIIDCWRCMEDYIKKARSIGNAPTYAEGFEALYNAALAYRATYKSQVPLRTD